MTEQSKEQQASEHVTCDEEGNCKPSGINLVPKKEVFFLDDGWGYLTQAQKDAYTMPIFLTHFDQYDWFADKWTTMYPKWQDIFTHSLDSIRTALGATWIFVPAGGIGMIQYRHSSDKAVFPYADFSTQANNYISNETIQYNIEGQIKMPTFWESLVFEYNNTDGYNDVIDVIDKVNSTTTPTEFVDFISKFPLPYKYNELDNYNFFTMPLYVKTDSRYNFHIPEYERLTSGEGQTKFKLNTTRNAENVETLLPSMNNQIFDKLTGDSVKTKKNDGTFEYSEIANLYDLHSTLGRLVQDVFKDTVSPEGKSLKSDSKGMYFRKWARKFKKFIDEDDPRPAYGFPNRTRVIELLDAFKRQVFPAESVKTINKHNDRKYLFPMYNEIEFSTDTNTLVTDLLKEMRMDYSVLKTIAQGINGDLQDYPNDNNRGRIGFANDNERFFTCDENTIQVYGGNKAENLMSRAGDPTNSFRFYSPRHSDWLGEYMDEGANMYAKPATITPLESAQSGVQDTVIPNSDHAVYVDAYPEPSEITMTDPENISNKFFKNIMFGIFKKRFAKIVEEKTRNYAEIINGKQAYSETFCYSVEKWSVDAEGNPDQKLQTTLLQNSNDIDVIKYVDTQVIYNKSYIYKIKQWQIFFGSSYKYDSVANFPTTNDLIKPEAPKDLVDLDWYKRDLYRTAAELLGADLAQRMYAYNAINNASGQDYTQTLNYSPVHGDTQVLNHIACGEPLTYYSGYETNILCAPLDDPELFGFGDNLPFVGVVEDPNVPCCSRMWEFDESANPRNEFGPWRGLLATPTNNADDGIAKLMEVSAPPPEDCFCNPSPLPNDVKGSYFDHHVNTDPMWKNVFKNYDGVEDIRTWWSATIFSLVSRRASYMLNAGLLIDWDSLRQNFGSVASNFYIAGINLPWLQDSTLEERIHAMIKIFGHESYNTESIFGSTVDPVTHQGVFKSQNWMLGDMYDFQKEWDTNSSIGSWHSWNKLDIRTCLLFLKGIKFQNLRDAGSNQKLSDELDGYKLSTANRLENQFQEKLNAFLLEFIKFVTSGIPDSSDLEALSEEWDKYDEKWAHWNNEANKPPPEPSGYMQVDIKTKPYIKFYELPFYETQPMMVTDYLPIHPNVDIIPFKGVNNEVLINLSCNVGEYMATPVPLIDLGFVAGGTGSGTSFFAFGAQGGTAQSNVKETIIRQSIINSYMQQYMVDQDTAKQYLVDGVELKYRNDDMINGYEMLRIDNRPQRWSTFSNDPTLVTKTISSEGFSAVSLIDNIKPNKKYYYTFRTMDSHSHRSNPTPVYRVELVDTDGSVYLLVDIIEVKPLKKKKTLKKFGRRYVNVIPTMEQTLIDEERSGLNPLQRMEVSAADAGVVPSLGIVEPGLFNHSNPIEKFKVRLTSKSTGKKIDFNLKFKVENVKPPATQNPTGDAQEPEGDGQESG